MKQLVKDIEALALRRLALYRIWQSEHQKTPEETDQEAMENARLELDQTDKAYNNKLVELGYLIPTIRGTYTQGATIENDFLMAYASIVTEENGLLTPLENNVYEIARQQGELALSHRMDAMERSYATRLLKAKLARLETDILFAESARLEAIYQEAYNAMEKELQALQAPNKEA